MDFIDLLEFVVREAHKEPDVFRRPQDMDCSLDEANTGLNELEQVLLVVLMGQIYGVSDEIVDAAPVFDTPRKLRDFLETHAARIPRSLEQTKEWLDG